MGREEKIFGIYVASVVTVFYGFPENDWSACFSLDLSAAQWYSSKILAYYSQPFWSSKGTKKQTDTHRLTLHKDTYM